MRRTLLRSPAFGRDLRVEHSWEVSGRHYEQTANAWAENLAHHRAAVSRLVGRAGYWRWRMFLLACAELWGYAGGCEWQVSHYRLAPVAELAPTSRAQAGVG